MSVLNQSGEEQVECPLCMEPLEVDDLNFFPCTCGYQICRFCWHRIRTDENGLCPACRKAYSENPADFTPLSKEQVAQLKSEKRQRDQLRKAKLSESRKHLASVRVVQRNLVFVVGLPMRLADPEILKKHEYFGKFGKIHKVVINQSTAYAGTQGPSASAYVTYLKSDDALRAIQSVNNTTLDGKTIKTSLGTTKYCSHFMKNQTCPKPDCMYLHDFGDQEASFTKEQMHAGKHQEYEKKLHDGLLAKQASQQQAQIAAATSTTQSSYQQASTNHSLSPINDAATSTSSSSSRSSKSAKDVSTTTSMTTSTVSIQITNSANKEVKDGTSWPQLDKDVSKLENNRKHGEKLSRKSKKQAIIAETNNRNKSKSDDNKDTHKDACEKEKESKDKEKNVERELKRPAIVNNSEKILLQNDITHNNNTIRLQNEIINNNGMDKIERVNLLAQVHEPTTTSGEDVKLTSLVDDNSSFFTSNSFSCAKIPVVEDEPTSLLSRPLNGQEPILDVSDGDAWDFNFGYANHSNHLEELAKQRGVSNALKDPLDSFANGLGLDTFSKLDSFMDAPYVGPPTQGNTESLLETLAKNSVNYQNMHQQHQQPQQQLRGGFHMNGHKDLLGLIEQQHAQQQGSGFPKIMDMYRTMCAPQQHLQQMNGLHSQSNGFHNNFPQQQQHHFNHLNIVDKQLALLQQRQMEENFLNLTLGKQMQPQQQPQRHPLGYMNGHYDSSMHNGTFPQGGSFGLSNNPTTNNAGSQSGQKQNRQVVDDKDLDYRFQEAQKALEALVESDSHVHNSGRTTLGSNQQNGIVHSQSGNHLPPPPPGFVQPTTHMNSFGSKILPFLNMNSQQQQQISNPQNNWPSSFSQIQQQPNQHKGMGGVCNDWKVLDPAILTSRRHIPSMGPLIDQYSPQQPPPQPPQQQHQPPQQQRAYDMYAPFSSYSAPLQPPFNNGYGGHHVPQSNLNWLSGGELNAPISTPPPGFRTTGQASKQQEC